MRTHIRVVSILLLSQVSFAAELPPVGALLGAGADAKGLYVYGWAQDPKAPQEPVRVDFYINRPAQGPDYSNIVGSISANLPPDAANGLTGFSGMHGFRFFIPPSRFKDILDPNRALYAYAWSAGARLPITNLSSTPLKLPVPKPMGQITGTRQDASGMYVAGSAWDPLSPGSPIELHFYINRPAQGPDYSNFVGSALSDPRNRSCEFKFPLNRVRDLAAARAIYAYAFSADKSQLSRLNIAAYTLPVHQPVGAIERYESSPQGVFVYGWALDPKAPTQPVRVDIYRDGPPQGPLYENALGHTTADIDRSDITAKLKVAGSHGFRFAIPPQFLQQERRIYAYAYSGTAVAPIAALSPPLLIPNLSFNPLLLGNNLDWVALGDGLFERIPVAGTMMTRPKPLADRLIKELGVRMIRYPGGNLAECFNWLDSIDVPGRAVRPVVNYSECQLGAPTSTSVLVGLDEFLRFCEAHQIEPLITIGISNNTYDRAAKLVEYVNRPADETGNLNGNLGNLRARNGHPKPYNVKYWEIGNEIYKPSFAWLPLENRWNRAVRPENQPKTAEGMKALLLASATQYGIQAQEMAKAMKAVSPAIKVGVIGLGTVPQWDDNALGPCSGNFADYAVLHRYLPNALTASDITKLQDINCTSNGITESSALADAVLRAPSRIFGRELANLAKTAKGDLGKCASQKRAMNAAVSEYNLDFGSSTAGGGSQQAKSSDMEQALFIAESIRQMTLNKDLLFATKYNIAHEANHYFADIHVSVRTKDSSGRVVSGPARLTASYFAQKLFSMAQLTTLFEITPSVAPLIPEYPNACVLSAVANLSPNEVSPLMTALGGRNARGGVSILVINRGTDPYASVSIPLPGVTFPAKVSLTVLEGQDAGIELPASLLGDPAAEIPSPYRQVTADDLQHLLIPGKSLTLIEIPMSAITL